MYGPMKTPFLNGSKYFILFLDDFNRMCQVYFLKQKLEVVDVFKRFKKFIKDQIGLKIKVLRSNNDIKYTSDGFDNFCLESGIQHQLTISYIPQQNKASERKNKTILEKARRLLFENNLAKKFQAAVVNISMYLLNRLLTKALKDKTPFEVTFGFKPIVEHPKIFGCLQYSYILKVKRDKLDRKS